MILAAVMGSAVLASCRSGVTRSPDDTTRDAMLAEWRQQAIRDSVRAVLTRGLADSAFPAAYAVIGNARGVYASFGVGSLDSTSRGNGASAVTDSSVWDLASLTKVIGTTSSIMQLVANGRVALDAPASRYLPRWKAPRTESITVRHLLTHSAGLPAWRPLYKEAWSAEEAMAQVYATSPDTLPGARYVYSDLGFILLGEVVREVSGLPLDSYVMNRMFLPMGMRETRFLPSALWQSRTAPTEIDPWRQRLLRGEVHDENAFQLGAVSGHAGLFSTARDLTRFAQTLLRSGWSIPAPRNEDNGNAEADSIPVIDAATLRAFTARQTLAGSHRALGWETPNGSNSAGSRMSTSAFGHTGFTGTSLWIDPAQDLFVLLLTNRVNPTRQRQGIARVRTTLADAVVGAIAVTAAPLGTSTPNLE
jgi:CubicO group peptidase (beta-lactamase class C family)